MRPRATWPPDELPALMAAVEPRPPAFKVQVAGAAADALAGAIPRRSDCAYTYCYCEENVWHLCALACIRDAASYAVFVSNQEGQVKLWQQRSGYAPDGWQVVWDYHVICVSDCGADGGGDSRRYRVFDLDSRLEWGSAFDLYAEASFRPEERLAPEQQQRFRVVPARQFLRLFASDRSHMRRRDGSWHEPPPPYSPIRTASCSHNLDRFRDTRAPDRGTEAGAQRRQHRARGSSELRRAVHEGELGAALSLAELLALFGGPPSSAAGRARKARRRRSPRPSPQRQLAIGGRA